MKIVNIKGQDFKVIDNWLDLSVEKYIQIANLHSKIESMVEEEFLVEFIKIISTINDDFINELYEDDLTFFIELMNSFNLSQLNGEKASHFILDNKIYSYNDIGKLTLGEKISLKLLEKGNISEYETWLNILSILVRPATKKSNEFNEDVYEVEKFVGDIAIINKRKELVKNIPAVNALHIIQSFTIGRE
jgi:hypothetical protein